VAAVLELAVVVVLEEIVVLLEQEMATQVMVEMAEALVAVVALETVAPTGQELSEEFGLSGPATLAHSHQQIQVIYNGSIIYQSSRRSTSEQPSLREQPYSGLWLRAT
jgi:hypothetical protein